MVVQSEFQGLTHFELLLRHFAFLIFPRCTVPNVVHESVKLLVGNRTVTAPVESQADWAAASCWTFRGSEVDLCALSLVLFEEFRLDWLRFEAAGAYTSILALSLLA